MSSKLKQIILIVSWNVLIIVILFGACEIVLRYHYKISSAIVRAKYYNDLLGDFDPNMCWTDQRSDKYPYRFTTNSQGFRSLREITKIKSPKTIRVLCLGDSFTMGWGVNDEDTYPELLYQALKREYPAFQFEVINAGNIFSNILDEMDYFNQKGIKTEPDLVILQFYTNDIYNEMTRSHVNRIFNRVTLAQYKNPLLAFLHRNIEQLALYNFLAKNITLLKDAGNRFNSQDTYNSYPLNGEEIFLSSLLVHDFDRLDTASNFSDLLNERNLKANTILWDNYGKALVHFKRELDELGIPLLFVIVPSSMAMYKSLNAPLCYFNPIMKENNITYIDFYHILRNYSKDHWEKFYLKGDGHTNSLGNVLLASTMAKAIYIEKDAQGRPRLTIHPDKFEKNCQNVHHIVICQQGNELAICNADLFTENFETNFTNISIPNDEQMRNGFSFFENRGGDGSIDLHFTFKQEINNFDMLFTKNIDNDLTNNNGYTVSYSAKTGSLFYVSDDQGSKNGGWSMEKRLIDVALPNPSRELTIRFDFKNRAGLVFANTYSKDMEDFCVINFYGSSQPER